MCKEITSSIHKKISDVETLLITIVANYGGEPDKSIQKKVPITSLVEGMKLGIYPVESRKNRWAKRTNTDCESVFWNGNVNSNDQNNTISGYNGLVCFRLNNLSDNRLLTLHNALKNDPYTFILFKLPRSRGLQVVVKSGSQDSNEHELYFSRLVEYYKQTYNIDDKEYSNAERNAYKHYRIYSDTEICFRPDSTIINKYEKEQSILRSDKLRNLFDAITLLDKQILLYSGDEYQKDKHRNVNVAIDINKSLEADVYSLQIRKGGGKRKRIIKLEHDHKTGNLLVLDTANDKLNTCDRVLVEINVVKIFVLSLLNMGETEQCIIQQKVEEKFNRKNRTVRECIGQILKTSTSVSISDGKSVKVKRRRVGNKYYLYLEETPHF